MPDGTTEPTSPPETQKKAPMSRALVVFAVLAYCAFLVYSVTRSLYAQCPCGQTVSRGWALADGLTAAAVGGILAAVARGALNASDLPEEVQEKLSSVISSIEELREAETQTLAELRERRQSQWQFPTEPTAAAPPSDEPQLTTREFILSSGAHVRAKVKREAPDA